MQAVNLIMICDVDAAVPTKFLSFSDPNCTIEHSNYNLRISIFFDIFSTTPRRIILVH